MINGNPLPIDSVLPDLRKALAHHSCAILSAEPGAGKTTRVPHALLDEPWLQGNRIIMLEPRRIAARRAAVWIAGLSGEQPGGIAGYRIRGESVVGPKTRIEVVTEAVLTRMLHHDQSLPGTGLVIFDEFHERNIHTDTGLAFALDVQQNLRPGLRILIMSATIDGSLLSALLGGAPLIEGKGRVFPVDTRYLSVPSPEPVERQTVSAIKRALRDDTGDLLVFLPGRREIHRVRTLLEQDGLGESTIVHSLYGDALPAEQEAALSPSAKGERKVILSTSVAETSLTIEGVKVVIDSGLSRVPRFDPGRGMAGLVTVPVSLATADQRRGRAGRTGPGICYRLWTRQREMELPARPLPEILVSDLAPLALDLALWGSPDGSGLRFPDPPPPAHLAQGRELLNLLGAVDGSGKILAHGRIIAAFPVHPRIANMLVTGKELGLGSQACDVAVLLEEADLSRGNEQRDVDLHSRWSALRRGSGAGQGPVRRAREQASRLRNILGVPVRRDDTGGLGLLLALCYPDRIARRREADGNRYQMAGGAGAFLPKQSALLKEEFLAVGDVDGLGNEVKIFLAEPVTMDDLRRVFPGRFSETEEVLWDEKREMVSARRIVSFGGIEISRSDTKPHAEFSLPAMLQGIRQMGLGALPWSKESESLRSRSEWLRLRGLTPDGWPDLSDAGLLSSLENWLGPFLNDVYRKSDLRRLDLTQIIHSMFQYEQLRVLERMAPTHIVVPTGSRIPLDYNPTEKAPVLAVRLQEMFGQTTTPAVADGKVPVLIHLLSPAHRPVAVTQDLVSFWANAYADVRKDMRGRYPKHVWPDDPLSAEPTRRAKPRKR
jgi:ATP-dependent helicase HrpB